MEESYGYKFRTAMSVAAFLGAMIGFFVFDNADAFWAGLIISTIWDASK